MHFTPILQLKHEHSDYIEAHAKQRSNPLNQMQIGLIKQRSFLNMLTAVIDHGLWNPLLLYIP